MRPFSVARALLGKNVPIYVHYGITHRCNLTCRMCGLWKTGKAQDELDTKQIIDLAGLLASLGCSFISIGGGEPLLRDDLPEIIKAFLAKGINIRILTNGVIPNRKILDRAINAGLSNISVSLDTLYPKRQEEICNREGIWYEVIDTLLHLAPVLKERKGLGLLNVVVSSKNIDELPGLVDFAETLGFYCSFVPLEIHHFSGVTLGCADQMQDMQIEEKDAEDEKTFEKLIEMKKAGRSIFNSTPFLREASKYLSGKPFSWKCLAGKLYFSISPEGDFSICHRFLGYTEEGVKIPIYDKDFQKVFSSREYKKQCGEIIGKCHACLRPCWAEVSFMFTDPVAFSEMVKIQAFSKYPIKFPDRRDLISRAKV